MKYLKLFENFSNETEYLKDIFLELGFDNFSVNVKYINPTGGFLAGIHLYQIDIRKTEKMISRDSDTNNPSRRVGMYDDLTKYHFTIEEVWLTIQTAIDYMKEEGYKLSLLKGSCIIDEELGRTGPVIFDTDSTDIPKGKVPDDNKWEYDVIGLEEPNDENLFFTLN